MFEQEYPKNPREATTYPLVSQMDLVQLMGDDSEKRDGIYRKIGILPIPGEQYAIDLEGFPETQFITIEDNLKPRLDKFEARLDQEKNT